ncbi:protein Daple [Diachasma alloeum]|uniref:protein Daple n=1 Tax=Diachasma alloeum TaxID=454923 RepID=UPI0007382CB7|nr:protein Daple [Diachasma alloeum]
MATAEVDNFLAGPLVTWFVSCLEDPDILSNYNDLVDGVLIHNVFLQIDPEPLNDGVISSCGNTSIRIKNLEMIVGNMKQFYEEELGHLIIKHPDTTNLGKEPEVHIQDMELLLLLLLGCAVQCPNKKNFITRIKTLPLDTQLAIVECIKQVTDYHDIVITQDSMENANMSGVFKEIKKLIHERDLYREKWRVAAINDSTCPNDSPEGNNEGIIKSQQLNSIAKKSAREEHHHYAVELADWKSKVRKQRQELEEKTEALLECKEELEHNRQSLAKLKQENQELMHEARTAKSYRDELDAVMERAERADRLESEVARYREKLTDIEFYKTRIEELREDNRVLMENREMLEEQLSLSRRRADKVLELEAQIIEYKQVLNDMALERAADKEKYQELYDENLQLHKLKKAADDEVARAGSVSESDEPVTSDNRLSEQLTNNAQTRALKLELENRRLMALVDSLKENSFHESSGRLLELEKEKKKMSLKMDSLTDNNDRLSQQNADLELVCKQALEENKKLENTLKNQRTSFERQQQDYQAQHSKIIELEKNYETAIKEKQRVQSLLESVQRRADELDRSLEISNQKLEDLRLMENKLKEAETKCTDVEIKIVTLEKDKETALRDVHKCRELIEEKDVALDKATNDIEVMRKKIDILEREVDKSISQITRLQEIERSSKELDSRAAIDKETMETLKSNLIAEKLNTQQLQTALEKLGLTVDSLLTLSSENLVERLINVPEMSQYINKLICEKIEHEHKSLEIAPQFKDTESEKDVPLNKHLQETIETLKRELESSQVKFNTSQIAGENLLEEQAKLQVCVTTLQSKITSLNAQHTALQLANSQLVAEKEQLLKERDVQQRAHQQLLHDQVTLQSLHEQLNNEYENLLQERETLKASLRDTKNHFRTLRENFELLEEKNKQFVAEQEASLCNTKSLNNLRGEHSKLKDDFRNLYTATEKLKAEYRNLQEDYRKNKVEANRLSLKLTELQGEMSIKEERCSNLELQTSKLNQRCEMLLQMNSGLDNNRRSLMDHVSVLLNQYHDLLSHSLEDKEHYHMEEKLYRDQVNHLSRQKEKLEEKIMEYYRNKQSCSTKKKRFGASLVKRVRKAGSDLLNKNRQSWPDESKQSDGKLYESESGGNDSDASGEGRRTATETPVLDNDSYSLGTPGTRRTVYYTDDSPSPATSLPPEQKCDGSPQSPIIDDDPQSNRPTQDQTPRSVLIYNKVSAVINETQSLTTPVNEQLPNEEIGEPLPAKDPKVGNSVWYEYGCV